jgi:hypothetical protein
VLGFPLTLSWFACHRIALIQLCGPSACILVRPVLTVQGNGHSSGASQHDMVVDGSKQQGQQQWGHHQGAGTGWLPPALVSLLEDPGIIKAGVGCYEDGWVTGDGHGCTSHLYNRDPCVPVEVAL